MCTHGASHGLSMVNLQRVGGMVSLLEWFRTAARQRRIALNRCHRVIGSTCGSDGGIFSLTRLRVGDLPEVEAFQECHERKECDSGSRTEFSGSSVEPFHYD